MSSPIVTTLFAKNEYSASEVTTHSCFLLSNGQEIIRKLNMPEGWNHLRLYFKFALYSDPLPSANLSSTRFTMGICSDGYSIGTGHGHWVGLGMQNDSLTPATWNINGDTSAGGVSASLSVGVTNPPRCAWQASPYVSRPYNLVNGAITLEGAGASGLYMPFYNTAWSSSYTSSTYPTYQLAGFGWRTISLEFYKSQPQSASVAGVINRVFSAYSNFGGGIYNSGINTPRAVVRNSSLNPIGLTVFDYSEWATWYKDVTNDNNVGTYIEGGNVGTINETTYGPLNCVNMQWLCGSGVQLAIRDIEVVKIA